MMRPATRTVTRADSSASAVCPLYPARILRHGMREVVLARIRRMAERFDLFQFLAPDFVDVFVECQ